MSLRKNIVEMSTKIPESMSDWLDSVVLMCVTVADSVYCVRLRRHHRICSDRDQEKNYELVSPDPEERVSFPSLIQGERPFFYTYDYFFNQLNITIPFTPF
ncbi:uncharacterized protein DS421_13g411370 [Arachis hypogaea]|nr:uncharacterized protein DS421_13g411370 [Arachis hypogaea]